MLRAESITAKPNRRFGEALADQGEGGRGCARKEVRVSRVNRRARYPSRKSRTRSISSIASNCEPIRIGGPPLHPGHVASVPPLTGSPFHTLFMISRSFLKVRKR